MSGENVLLTAVATRNLKLLKAHAAEQRQLFIRIYEQHKRAEQQKILKAKQTGKPPPETVFADTRLFLYTQAFIEAVRVYWTAGVETLVTVDAKDPHMIADEQLVYEIEHFECVDQGRVSNTKDCMSTLHTIMTAADLRRLRYRRPQLADEMIVYERLPPKPKEESPYGVLPERRQQEPTGYGSIPGQDEPKYAPVPGFNPTDARMVFQHLLPRRRLPPIDRRLPTIMTRTRPTTFDVSSLDVALPEMLVDSLTDTLKDVATISHGLSLKKPSLQKVGYGVFADRAFGVGEYVTVFDGELVTYEDAKRKQQYVHEHLIQTLQPHQWAIVGDSRYVGRRAMIGRPAGAFIATTLDVCESISQGREVTCNDAEVNCRLVVVNERGNGSGDAFDPQRARIVVVATKAIAVAQELYLNTERLGAYGARLV